MSRVVERCPNCGVEHDSPKGGACEVCGTTLRYWCRVHSKEIGWLDGPQCPRCAAEAAARTPAPPPRPRPPAAPPPRRPPPIVVEPEPEVPEWAGAPAPAGPPPYPGRDPRDVLREGAEDLLPHAAAGARLALRLARALGVVIRTVFLWALLGALGGGIYAYNQNDPEFVWTALFFAMIGGGVGLFIGFILALRVLFAPRPPRAE